jgi:hypothetical protein
MGEVSQSFQNKGFSKSGGVGICASNAKHLSVKLFPKKRKKGS